MRLSRCESVHRYENQKGGVIEKFQTNIIS